jgi:FkbM family methyltransferase
VPRGYEGLYCERYEPKTVAALTRLVGPGYSCADIGANVGFFTLLMAQLAGPDGRVVAFEPREDMVAYLERNIALDGSGENIEVRRQAVTDGATDSIDLHWGGASSDLRATTMPTLAARETHGRRVVSVAAVALDACFGPRERIDVVKMDIEGGEAVAMLGARRLLAEQRPVFVVEFHRDVGWPVIGHLADADYRFEMFDGTRIDRPAEPRAVPSHFVAVPA